MFGRMFLEVGDLYYFGNWIEIEGTEEWNYFGKRNQRKQFAIDSVIYRIKLIYNYSSLTMANVL